MMEPSLAGGERCRGGVCGPNGLSPHCLGCLGVPRSKRCATRSEHAQPLRRGSHVPPSPTQVPGSPSCPVFSQVPLSLTAPPLGVIRWEGSLVSVAAMVDVILCSCCRGSSGAQTRPPVLGHCLNCQEKTMLQTFSESL